VRLEGLGQLKKIHLIGTRTRDLPACSIVPQPTTLPRASHRNSSSSIVMCIFISAETCLPSRCLAMNIYTGSAIPAFRRHVTILKYSYSKKEVKSGRFGNTIVQYTL
jgi:hypothetical protein